MTCQFCTKWLHPGRAPRRPGGVTASPASPPKYEWINILRSRAHLGGSLENLTACWECPINPNIYIRTDRRVFCFSHLTEMMTHTFVTATTKVLSLMPILSFDMILRSGKKKKLLLDSPPAAVISMLDWKYSFNISICAWLPNSTKNKQKNKHNWKTNSRI